MPDAPHTLDFGPATTADGSHPAPAMPSIAGVAPWEAPRRVLRVIALACALSSLLLLVALVAIAALGGGTANNDLAGLELNVTWALIWGSPVLIVVALNLLIWRALLRPLGRKAIGKRVALAITMVIVLAVLSVGAVAVLLMLGFLVGALASAGSGFGGAA